MNLKKHDDKSCSKMENEKLHAILFKINPFRYEEEPLTILYGEYASFQGLLCLSLFATIFLTRICDDLLVFRMNNKAPITTETVNKYIDTDPSGLLREIKK